MTKKTKIILMVAGMAIVIAIITLIITTNKNSGKKTEKLATPIKVVIPTRTAEKYFSDTGAKYISPTDGEYTEIELIKILRNKLPITNDYFSIDFDYKINKFIIKITDGSKINLAIWRKWMVDSGYNQISDQYLEIR